VEFDRREWAGRGIPGGVSTDADRDALVSASDRVEIYGPLATLLVERAEGKAPFVVSVTGSVAVGKSAAAAALAGALRPHPLAVVCTDGFLFPNRVLDARGLTARKGFPESFDHEALARFLLDVRAGAAEAHAPVYSHATYDIVEGQTQVVRQPDVLVLEGLPFPEDHVDFSVYLDADEADIERWFVTRFRALCANARADEASFFRPFADYSEEQATRFASDVWAAINRVNLEEHILPVRDTSDVILEKGPDHAVRRVRLRVG
jgi:type I pantothenate kinase